MGNVLLDMKFGRVGNGLIRLGMNGQLAVNVGGSYKYYNAKSKRLINCDQFVFDVGSEFFFVVPTNKVKVGDIIIVSGKPAYVLAPETDGEIKILNYEDASIKTILPERHTFLGGAYMYSKIVSPLGGKMLDKNTLFKYMMMNSMMGGNSNNGSAGGPTGGIFGSSSGNNGMNPMMMMMLMGGKSPFGELFDFSEAEDGLFAGLGMFGDDSTEDESEAVEAVLEA